MKTRNMIKQLLALVLFFFVLGNSTFGVEFDHNGGSQTVTLSVQDSWLVLSKPSWISVSPSSGLSYDNVITVTCSANSSTDSRSGTIVIERYDESDLTISVSQSGAPYELSFGQNGGSTTVTLSVQDGGDWSVQSKPSWIGVSPTNGLASDNVITVTCEANSSPDSRSGTIVIERFDESDLTISVSQSGATYFWMSSATGIYYNSGNVGIGVEEANYALDVNGTIHSSEVLIDQNFTQPDYVFEDDYILKSLVEVEQFIKENKHLPDIPSAKEVEENGVNLGEMHTKLLLKIEELTIYAIDLKKQNILLQNRLNKLECESNKEVK